MNAFKLSSLLLCAVALTLAGTGCKKKGPPPITRFDNDGLTGYNGDNLGNGGQISGGPGTGAGQIGGGDLATFNPDDYAQDRSTFAAETLYFEYDSSSIKASEESKISAVAAALKSDASAKLLVEGNCDERGTEEYNRSLGERRALAAREALANAGVDSGRVATRSYGEDRPADAGHSQSSWAKNRRDEFVLLHAK